jgi:PAS domain S-box-containing protein
MDVIRLSTARTVLERLWSLVPSGGALPADVWRRRLRFLVGLTWFHAGVIALSGPVLAYRWDVALGALFREGTVLHPVGEALIVASFAALASWRKSSRTVQATAVGFGLMSSSAILVHLSGGFIELHFHFFVMLVFLALLQDWIPYLLAVGFVAVHHGVVGVLWPEEVYNHPAAVAAPWTFAGIHALFVLGACVGSVIAWRFNERAFAQTALILEAAGEGIFGLDTEERITFMNPAAATMLRVNAARLVGKPLSRALRVVSADGTEVPTDEMPVLMPLRDGAPRYVTEGAFARIDGTIFPTDYVSTPIVERGARKGLVVSFRDVTQRKRVEADLQASHRRLEETLAELKTTQRQMLQQERLRAMGQMASGIAHDFNNTLSPILGLSEILLSPNRRYDQGQVENYMRLINTAARDASAVVRRLRDLYTDRGAPIAASAVDLAPCIEQVVALTQPRWKSQALARGATIHIDVDVPDLPRVAADSADLREALTNLIFNAVDAMPTGGTITIRARSDGAHVQLEVRDTGIGMTDDVRQQCLEPFFSTKGQQGSGLGLAMVHALVERHRGTCAIESTPGRGTTVILRLPLYTAPTAATMDDATRDRSRRLRILVVEDEPLVRLAITHQLSDDGHTVDSATNGAEGLSKLLSGWFDLVVTDRAMPEMSGDQLAAAIQSIAPNKPIIMLTGFGDLMMAKGERPPGVSLVVSKPVTQDQLRHAVTQATATR